MGKFHCVNDPACMVKLKYWPTVFEDSVEGFVFLELTVSSESRTTSYSVSFCSKNVHTKATDTNEISKNIQLRN